jgi:hypothetical protein
MHRMKGFLIAAGIIGALYLADQQYAQGKYTSAVGRMVTQSAAFVWSLRAASVGGLVPEFTCQVCGHRGADVRPLFEPPTVRMPTLSGAALS